MGNLESLKSLTSRTELADLLEIKPKRLAYELFKRKEEDRYTRFEIPKKHGGTREILAPNPSLKGIQEKLSDLLQDCQEEIRKTIGHSNRDGSEQIKLGFSHGFVRGRTIITNARSHRSRRYVFNIDLSDFFGTINFGRVRGFLIKDRNFLLPPDIATAIAQIACFDNKLPQGSPCSPVLANLIAHPLDIKLGRLAAQAGLTYTRYADDLTFSTNKKSFPENIAIKQSDGSWTVGSNLETAIRLSGFEINPQKTRMQYKDSRQDVTGLTVNSKVNVGAVYRYRVRAMVNEVFKTGRFEFRSKKSDRAGNIVFEKNEEGSLQQLLGMLAHIDYVDRYDTNLKAANSPTVIKEKNKKKKEEALFIPSMSRQELFKKFIYFYSFYSTPVPMIVCEGKTDNVYLKCAIKSQKLKYPELIQKENGTEKLKIRFFEYSESRTKTLTELSGGVGGICHFLDNYHSYIPKFIGPKPTHPVIVLIDNDKGGADIYGKIAGITMRKRPSGKEPFIYIDGNLYVVPTPFGPGGAPTAIENFFEESLLEEKLNGKEFCRLNDFDEKKFYGKAAFARDVVLKNMSAIKFDGFDPILSRIRDVLLHYAKLPR